MTQQTLDRRTDSLEPRDSRDPAGWCVTVLWNRRQAGVAGEVAWLRGGGVLGRVGGAAPDRLAWVRDRPGGPSPGEGIRTTYVSRDQLQLRPLGPASVEVRNVGRLELRVDGHPTRHAQLVEGSVLELDGEVVLLVQRRRPVADVADLRAGRFGEPCADGLVGEGPTIWRLRSELRRVAPLAGHVLVTGPSGTGKELVARALHAHSGRPGPLVTCNAAAIPEGVAAAEWFGNVRNYPNPGMPARTGLAAQADRGTLFVDELGELPAALQAQLLRLLDSGEVQQLGAPRPFTVDLRVVGATNRGAEALKHDVAARFPHRMATPGLGERPEDLGLLVAHLMRQPGFERFVRDGVPRVTPRLWLHLVRHAWAGHVRELLAILWDAAARADRDWLDAPGAVSARPPSPVTDDISEAAIREALAACGGVKTKAAAQLGLRSRHQLRRLMARYGMD
ncbi:MAG: sigma-54-dependent Fis family transcriptional regulator [Alphaproteobacteria bacterium]|nr:sigma-54-dependent Fis family transcriptional regulator [Alphaproteobacteria bacterium]